MRLARFCGAGLLLLAPLSPLWAADSAKEARALLEKMAQATRTLNYDGTFVYMHEGRLMTLRILHGADVKGERERLISLSGVPREVMRDERASTCILSDNRKVVGNVRARRPYSGALTIDVDRLANYYDFTLSGEDRIANRPARRVAVKPRDAYRYGYQLSVDSATGLLLKSDLINEEGKPVEQVMFTSLAVSDAPPAALQEPCDSEHTARHLKRHEEMASHTMSVDAGWQVAQLPAGFALAEHERHTMRSRTAQVEHIIFSDGLARVSVFIERLEEDDKFTGFSHRGAVNAFGVVVDDHQITVVGEVPRATVQLIGESIRHTAPVARP
ncbi:MAG: MucB/RseB C-terminal domain-containing protein [Proteobacteria bacterium]|nr:MucB/RseB C-terminal domain-containing protein [Pseudomonadota bacterium]